MEVSVEKRCGWGIRAGVAQRYVADGAVVAERLLVGLEVI